MTRGDVLGVCTYPPRARPLGGLLGPQPTTPSGVPQEAGQRADLDRSPARVGLLDLEACTVDVRLVNVSRAAGVAAMSTVAEILRITTAAQWRGPGTDGTMI